MCDTRAWRHDDALHSDVGKLAKNSASSPISQLPYVKRFVAFRDCGFHESFETRSALGRSYDAFPRVIGLFSEQEAREIGNFGLFFRRQIFADPYDLFCCDAHVALLHENTAQLKLLADEMEVDRPVVGMAAVFPEVDALPCAEAEASVLERDGKVHAGEGAADMGRHIVGAFGGVHEEPVAVRNDSRH